MKVEETIMKYNEQQYGDLAQVIKDFETTIEKLVADPRNFNNTTESIVIELEGTKRRISFSIDSNFVQKEI